MDAPEQGYQPPPHPLEQESFNGLPARTSDTIASM